MLQTSLLLLDSLLLLALMSSTLQILMLLTSLPLLEADDESLQKSIEMGKTLPKIYWSIHIEREWLTQLSAEYDKEKKPITVFWSPLVLSTKDQISDETDVPARILNLRMREKKQVGRRVWGGISCYLSLIYSRIAQWMSITLKRTMLQVQVSSCQIFLYVSLGSSKTFCY